LSAKTTRRRFLEVAAAGAAWVALTGTLGCEGLRRSRAPSRTRGRSRRRPSARARTSAPPAVHVATQARGTAPGYVFVAPKKDPALDHPKDAGQDGPMILDNSGRAVWFRPVRNESEDAMDFKVQYYRGEPVLTWWEGTHTGYGRGEYVVLDDSYREITRVQAANGYSRGDHHEFLITPQDTALITIYGRSFRDLSYLGGPEDGTVLEGIIQEVDIGSGEVLFEWHSLPQVALEESYYEPPEDPEWPFDYFHINSIDVDHDDNLLVSARRTCAVYKIDRASGEVMWRLGGKRSDFVMDPNIRTRSYQHDARRQPDGTITIFDNGVFDVDERSRGAVLELDEDAMIATLAREYEHPNDRVAATQGNMQALPGGNMFVGWGSVPAFSESGADGELLFSASFAPWGEPYRAFRFPWSGQPDDDPVLAAEPGPEDLVTLYASWNGATEVAEWEALAGPGPDRLRSAGTVPRDGFETAITVRTTEPYVGVRARDASGRVLGVARALKPGGSTGDGGRVRGARIPGRGGEAG
jgi:hypothetical protein